MKPPLHPAHPESVTFVPPSMTDNGRVDRTRVIARCGHHYTGPPRALGRESAAGELAADLDAHRQTYVRTESAG